MKKKLPFFIFLFFILFCSAQKNEFTTFTIADSLKQNANAVVRLSQIDITIASQRSMKIAEKRVVTVFNENGLSCVNAYEYYDKRRSIRAIQAIVYDSFGNEIKKIKRKEFTEQSAADGFTIFSDNRVVYLNYVPTQYPFTIVYESEVETSTTAFIPQWFPLNNYFLSIEKSVLNVNYPNNLGFKKKESNFSGFNIKKTTETDTQLSYVIENTTAQKQEDYSPAFNQMYPNVKMGLEVFNIEGIDGTAKTWKEFGKWYADALLYDTMVLPEETKAKIRQLVGEEKDPIEKAKIVYDYVQQKSRYVSIQVGIGGWKPMYVSDVDRLGYGDCKALSNYTRALLDAVEVPSYDTLLYGDKDKEDIDSEFVSMQGNHMILCIPNNKDTIFIECTSQVAPFGYQANFTDDRDVLIIKPEGGEIVRTKNYENTDNSQVSTGNYTLNEKGDLSGKISIVSKGSQYEKSEIERMQPDAREAYFKKYWSNIDNLKINSTTFTNDKEKVAFTIDADLSALNYGNLSSNKMMFALNVYNKYVSDVKRIRNRRNPFEIQRGYYDTDEIEISLATGFAIEFLPSNVELKGKYGEYKIEIIKKDDNTLIYKRSMLLKKGKYSSTEYDEYRLFMENISRNDNAKIILTKKTE
jgi:transglutaminase-like putative cysteine protease